MIDERFGIVSCSHEYVRCADCNEHIVKAPNGKPQNHLRRSDTATSGYEWCVPSTPAGSAA